MNDSNKKTAKKHTGLVWSAQCFKNERESTSIPAFSTSFEKWRALTTLDLPPFLSNQSWLVDALYRQQVHASKVPTTPVQPSISHSKLEESDAFPN